MNGKKMNTSFLHIFGSRCFIIKNHDQHTKFNPKSVEAIFVGYSAKSKVYRVLNRLIHVIEECFDITFDDNFVQN